MPYRDGDIIPTAEGDMRFLGTLAVGRLLGPQKWIGVLSDGRQVDMACEPPVDGALIGLRTPDPSVNGVYQISNLAKPSAETLEARRIAQEQKARLEHERLAREAVARTEHAEWLKRRDEDLRLAEAARIAEWNRRRDEQLRAQKAAREAAIRKAAARALTLDEIVYVVRQSSKGMAQAEIAKVLRISSARVSKTIERFLDDYAPEAKRRTAIERQLAAKFALGRYQRKISPPPQRRTIPLVEGAERSSLSTKDFELSVTVRNRRILEAMRKAGIGSVRQLGKKAGVHYPTLIRIVALKEAGQYAYSGEWRDAVVKLADFFRCLPEDLIPEPVRTAPMKRTKVTIGVTLDDIEAICGNLKVAALPPSVHVEREQMTQAIRNFLYMLTERQQEVIRRRFGIDCEQETLDELAASFHVSKECIRQIEAKALRRMQHPARAKELLHACGSADTVELFAQFG